jgi:NADPH:quinone reductase
LIAVHATSVNSFELLQIQGRYQDQPAFPWITGHEFSGVVFRTPLESDGDLLKYQVGNRVCGAAQGSFATRITVEEDMLQPIPDTWSFVEVAGLLISAATAYAALVVTGKLKKGMTQYEKSKFSLPLHLSALSVKLTVLGETVLIHRAARGVGLAAIQIAKALGVSVIATAGSQQKLDVAKIHRADQVLDYHSGDWPGVVQIITGKGRGVDVILDLVGLVGPSLECIGWNGRLEIVGFTRGKIENVPMDRVLLKNCFIVGLHWARYGDMEPEMGDEVWKTLRKMIESGRFGVGGIGLHFILIGLRSRLMWSSDRSSWGKLVVMLVPEERRIAGQEATESSKAAVVDMTSSSRPPNSRWSLHDPMLFYLTP